MSTNRTLVQLVAAGTVTGAEPANPALDPALLRLQARELVVAVRELPQVAGDERAHRGAALRGADSGLSIDLLVDRNCDVFHSITVSQPDPS